LSEPLTSLVIAEKRGHYGSSKFPGNCSGVPIKMMLEYFQPKYVLDPMKGSDTCGDVCKELEIAYDGFDIINGQNIFDQQFVFKQKYDFIHWHPPYWSMQTEYYQKLCDHPDNLGLVKAYDRYIEMLLIAYDKLFRTALLPSGIMAILCGLRKKNGKLFDMAIDLINHDRSHYYFEIIKAQRGINNKVFSPAAASDGNSLWSKKYHVKGRYTLYGHKFIPLMHEKYILFKKGVG